MYIVISQQYIKERHVMIVEMIPFKRRLIRYWFCVWYHKLRKREVFTVKM